MTSGHIFDVRPLLETPFLQVIQCQRWLFFIPLSDRFFLLSSKYIVSRVAVPHVVCDTSPLVLVIHGLDNGPIEVEHGTHLINFAATVQHLNYQYSYHCLFSCFFPSSSQFGSYPPQRVQYSADASNH